MPASTAIRIVTLLAGVILIPAATGTPAPAVKADSLIGPATDLDPARAFRGEIHALYGEIGLDKVLSQPVFELAMIGYANLLGEEALPRPALLTIIDYTKPSTEERLVIIDVQKRQLLNTSLVAHGRNSGDNMAVQFSDQPGSLMSSLGFFVTGDTYHGKHGYSLKLHGLEEPFNGNAEERNVIIHGADYVSESFIAKYGRLGRSWGCPALPLQVSSEIIDAIKGGSCLFVYYDDPDYLENSQLLDEDRATTW